MAQRAASYGEAVLHKTPFQTWHGVARRAKTAEAFAFANMKHLPSSFHSAMKHFAYAPYDLSSIALRATDDEKMENESSSVCNTTLSALYYALQSGRL